jgi:type IV pilus assembly protein PilB
MGFITEDQLFDALIEAKKSSLPVGSILVQKGYVSVTDLKTALSAQQGFETVNTEQLKIDENVLNILPEDFIKLNQVIPLSFDGKTLVVGMVNPTEKGIINDIVYLTGLRPRIMLITYYEFNMCIETYYSESKKETSQIIQKMEEQAIEYSTNEESLYEQAERELQDTSSIVVKFVNKIITDAIELKASDIHIEPRINNFAVRYRIDGILKEVLNLPSKIESAILTRLKVISKMNIAEHRRPQDGSFSIKYKNNAYDFRINTLPVSTKEKMVIRILTPAVTLSSAKQEMELIGAAQEDIDKIARIKSVPNGIILATGPTGSGKTTTLYALLNSINDEK